MPLYAVIPALVGVIFLGWCAGMLTFKRSSLWCRECGVIMKCPNCEHAGLDSLRPGSK